MKRLLLLISAVSSAPLMLALSGSPAAACGGWGQAPCPKAKLTIVPMNQPAKPAVKAAAPAPALAKTQLQPALGTNQNSSVINKSGNGLISQDGGGIYSPGVRNGVISNDGGSLRH
jgi:hypothetical protein